MPFRVAILAVIAENNTFTRLTTTMEDFRASQYFTGAEIVPAFAGTGSEIGGAIEVARARGWDADYLVAAHAQPGGPVDEAARREITDLVRAGLAEGRPRTGRPYDGVFVALHGAMVTETDQDGDSQLLRAIRSVVGPAVPIAVSLDLHANIFDEMAGLCEIAVSFRTYPHVDLRETAMRACTLLDDAMAGRIRPRLTVARPPMLVGCDDGRTTENGPMCRLLAEAARIEAAHPALLHIAVNAGFTDADVWAAGPSVVVTWDAGWTGDPATAAPDLSVAAQGAPSPAGPDSAVAARSPAAAAPGGAPSAPETAPPQSAASPLSPSGLGTPRHHAASVPSEANAPQAATPLSPPSPHDGGEAGRAPTHPESSAPRRLPLPAQAAASLSTRAPDTTASAAPPRADHRAPASSALAANAGAPLPAAALAADRAAAQLCRRIWELREDWTRPVPLDACIAELGTAQGQGAPRRGPIVVADYADNPGAGAYSDCTALIGAMLAAGIRDAAAGALLDPQAVALCKAAGPGATLTLEIGGRHDATVGGGPLRVTGQVIALSDGNFTYEGPMFTGLPACTGPSVCLRVDGLDLMIVSNRMQMLDANIFRAVGIEPRDKAVVAVKSMNHFKGAFGPMASRIIVTDAGGLCSPDVTRRRYRRLRRPVFPLDAAATLPG